MIKSSSWQQISALFILIWYIFNSYSIFSINVENIKFVTKSVVDKNSFFYYTPKVLINSKYRKIDPNRIENKNEFLASYEILCVMFHIGLGKINRSDIVYNKKWIYVLILDY